MERYNKLKKRLLTIIKNMFIKIFTRDYNDIIKGIGEFPFEELGIQSMDPNDEDYLFNINCNTEILKIVFPEF